MSWSSGKDSAWTLYLLQRDPTIELAGLFTVINKKYNRASMHATRIELLERQAEAAGLTLKIVELPDQCTNKECDAVMEQFITACVAERVESIAFGDLFLEDIRLYREKQLSRTGITPLFPLWKMPTAILAREMMSAGVKAFISSVDLAKLPPDLAGRQWTRELVDTIPAECDPCGENGELHTIVVEGPMFHRTIAVHVGEIIEREGFVYADIIPD